MRAIGSILVLALNFSIATASELGERLKFWEEQAFHCVNNDVSFPSKAPHAPSGECDDGDMTLFNGLLCAAGDMRGCEAVKRSQSGDGRWWRSPRQVGREAHGGHDVSFSPDQALGVLLFFAQTRDIEALRRWLEWLDLKRPCLVKVGTACLRRGWPRFCPDDTKDKRCSLRPDDCVAIERVGQAIGVAVSLCRKAMSELSLPLAPLNVSLETFSLGSATVNDKGYPLHLSAVKILLLKKIGSKSPLVDVAARRLVTREPNNPFFVFLAEGAKSEKALKLTLDLCPSRERPSRRRFQWSWERDSRERAWLDSMYWECIFMSKLLLP